MKQYRIVFRVEEGTLRPDNLLQPFYGPDGPYLIVTGPALLSDGDARRMLDATGAIHDARLGLVGVQTIEPEEWARLRRYGVEKEIGHVRTDN